MRRLVSAVFLSLAALASVQAGPAEKAAVKLFAGELQPEQAAKVWKKKRLKPAKAVEMLRELFPFQKAKAKDHTAQVRDRQGRVSEIQVGLPDRPRENGRFGVLVLLHGLGGSSSRVFEIGRRLAPPGTIVVAPNAEKPWDGLEYEDLRTAKMVNLPIMERFPHWWSYRPDGFPMLALDYVISRYPVDTDHVLLVGYSMGGFGTWNIGLRYHDRFSGLVPLAGGISREEFLLGKDAFCRDLLDNARRLPIFFAHGDKDTVVPVKFDRWTAEELEKRGYDFVYEEVAGGGHVLPGIVKQADLSDKLSDWLEERRRDPHPDHVVHRSLRPYHPGAYWVRVDGFTKPSAHVEAKCTDRTSIDVSAEGAAKVTIYMDPELVDTKQAITVTVNGKQAFKGKVPGSLLHVAESFARTRDPALVYAAAVTVPVK